MKVSHHALKRGKERLGLGRKAFSRIAQRALELGLAHAETTGNLRIYVDGLFLSHLIANNIRIYGEKVYVFRDTFLITVFHLPNDLKRSAHKLFERKRGNNDGKKEDLLLGQ